MKKKQMMTLVAVSLILSAPLLFASGSQDNDGDGCNPAVESSIKITKGAPEDYLDQVIPMETILEKAKAALVSGISVIGISLDDENGNLVYSVDLSDSTVAIIDAGNGEVLYTGKEVEDQEEKGDNEERDKD